MIWGEHYQGSGNPLETFLDDKNEIVSEMPMRGKWVTNQPKTPHRIRGGFPHLFFRCWALNALKAANHVQVVLPAGTKRPFVGVGFLGSKASQRGNRQPPHICIYAWEPSELSAVSGC